MCYKVKTKTWRDKFCKHEKTTHLWQQQLPNHHMGDLCDTSSVTVLVKCSPSVSRLNDQCKNPRLLQRKGREEIVRKMDSLVNGSKIFEWCRCWTEFTLTSTVYYGSFPLLSVLMTLCWINNWSFYPEVIISACDPENVTSPYQDRHSQWLCVICPSHHQSSPMPGALTDDVLALHICC